MRIPHDPVALEEHFKDDDEGPVSNQGYMPYLNKFILDKVPGTFKWFCCFEMVLLPALNRTNGRQLARLCPSVMMSSTGDGGDCVSSFSFVMSGCLEFFHHDVIVL